MFKITARTVILLSALTTTLLSACTKLEHISFEVKTPGIKNGVFVVKNDAGQMAYSANIFNGVLKLDEKVIEQPGYYMMSITVDGQKQNPDAVEVYLVPGKYGITLGAADAANNIYPTIKSPSGIQTELSDYYSNATRLAQKRKQAYNKLNDYLNDHASTSLSRPAFEVLVKNTAAAKDKMAEAPKDAMTDFLKEHPKNVTGAHIIANLDYESDAGAYYKMYSALSAEAKSSDEAKSLGVKLSKLAKLLPGQPAPTIEGKTPDGKAFNPADFKKKIYLVEFWKATSEMARTSHGETSMTNLMSTIARKEDVGLISISLDKKRDWWTSAIKDDKMTWAQFADLKGNDSPNAENWGIKRIPTYYLVDGNWHIIDRDIYWSEIPVVINQYLKHH